jgi:hypothetical protein
MKINMKICLKCESQEWNIDNKKILCQKCGEPFKCRECGGNNWLFGDVTLDAHTSKYDKNIKNLACMDCKMNGKSTVIFWNEKTGRTIP